MNRYNHANKSAESKITPGAILPCESAEELARKLITIVQSKDGCESQAEGEVAVEISTHDAEELKKAADRAVGWLTGHSADPDELAEQLRAVILGEGKA